MDQAGLPVKQKQANNHNPARTGRANALGRAGPSNKNEPTITTRPPLF